MCNNRTQIDHKIGACSLEILMRLSIVVPFSLVWGLVCNVHEILSKVCRVGHIFHKMSVYVHQMDIHTDFMKNGTQNG